MAVNRKNYFSAWAGVDLEEYQLSDCQEHIEDSDAITKQSETWICFHLDCLILASLGDFTEAG